MDNPALGNQVKALLVGAVALLLAVVVGFLVGSEDYGPLLFGTFLVLGASVWFLSGRFFWVLTIASSFLGGTFPILGGSFTPFQMMLMMGVAKFVFEDVIIRRRARMIVDRADLLLIAGFMIVLTVHGVHDRFGMRFLGSTVWGGRNYINVYVGLIAFFVVQSMPLSPKLWNKLPIMILAVNGFDLFVAVVTTIFPSSIYKIYPFYSAVSQASIDELVFGGGGGGGRIGAFGNFGNTLVLIVFSTVSIRLLFHPANFFKLVTACIGAISVFYSGFRSAVIQMLLGAFAAGVRDLKKGVFVVVPVAAALLFSISLINSEVVRLPRQIQRGLAFVPGNWDAEMARDAAASNDFRARVWTLWWSDYFPRTPIFGRGFGFNSEWTKDSVYGSPRAADYQQMVETGNIHNGFFASLDAIGIVGTLFFVLWSVRLLYLSLTTAFRRNDAGGFTLRFLALYIAVAFIAYWGGASTLGTFLPQQFAIAGVFLRVRRETPTLPRRERIRPAPATPERFRRRLVRV